MAIDGSPSRLFSAFEIVHAPFQSFVHFDHWTVPELCLCTLTAVVVMSTCQCHSHGCEGGGDGDNGAKCHTHIVKDHGQPIDEPVGKPYLWLGKLNRFDNLPHELPEWKGSIIGDVVGLR